MDRKIVVCLFVLFSMRLFCAEKDPTGAVSKVLREKRRLETKSAEEPAKKRPVLGKLVLNNQYKKRRNRLMEEVKNQYPEVNDGVIVLFAHFEVDIEEFQQEPNFYYLTGVKEPGSILLLDFSGESILYVPAGLKERSRWTPVQKELLEKNGEGVGLSHIVELGNTASGPFFEEGHYLDLCGRLREVTQKGGTTFTLQPVANTPTYANQTLTLIQLGKFVPNLLDHTKNILSILFSMRQVKDKEEIACLHEAVAITIKAHLAAVKTIQEGKTERDVRAAVDGAISTESRPGFFPIIGSGPHTTVLHNPASDRVMHDGELVVVDIGARAKDRRDPHSADLTRTYPISGKFSAEQRKIYSIVLGALEHVAERARPGYYFANKEDESRSLFHITMKYFKEYGGYDKYFPHGIGHHIGLHVHEDCVENTGAKGTFSRPLQPGNAIALEPGLYLPPGELAKKFGRAFKEGFGIRIESNYLITEDGAVCLDAALPKDPGAIEQLVQQYHTDIE